MSLFQELKRRNVFRVGVAYLVAAWLLVQIADPALQVAGAEDWVLRALVVLLALGFIPAVIFAWAFELTPEGLRKESEIDRGQSITHHTGRKLNLVIIALLVVAIGLVVADRLSGPDEPGRELASSNSPGDTSTSEPAATESLVANNLDGIPEASIAVLPFVNMSNDPEQEFFSDGISEELLNVLAKFPGLRVAARTSSFQFKGQNQDIGEIAHLLKVRHVLEGSVRKAGNKLRITAQLIEAGSGYHLWSESYDRDLDDVFAIQDEIAAAIGEAMRVELALDGDAPASIPRVAESANTAAYEAYLKGRHLVNQRGRSNIVQAVEDLKRAVRLDPDFAPGHAWMAIAWVMMLDSPGSYGDLSLAEVTERATPHIERALELDPDLAEAHGARALLAMNSAKFQQAMDSTARALELNPAYVDAMNWRQISASNFGEYAVSLELLKRIIDVDPLSIIGRLNYAPSLAVSDLEGARRMAHELAEQHAWAGYTTLSIIEYQSGRDLSASLGWVMRAYGEDPQDELSNRNFIRILSEVGEYDEARRISDSNWHIVDITQGRLESAIHDLQRAHEVDPNNLAPLADLADALHLAGRFEESRQYYHRLRDISPTHMVFDTLNASTISTVRMAYTDQQLGDEAAAREALEKHRADLARREHLGQIYFSDHLAEAMARVMEGNEEGAFESIRTAMDLGARNLSYFREPALQSLSGHPEFAALRAEMQQFVDAEHAKVMQLICIDNPIPDTWQPLRQTCMGVTPGP